MKWFLIQVRGHLIVLKQVGRILFEKLENMLEIQLGMNSNEKPLKLIQVLGVDLGALVQDLLLKNL